jgi:hypothetical protein
MPDHLVELPCEYCWSARADDRLIDYLVERAAHAVAAARAALADIEDPVARSSWVKAWRSDDPEDREAAERSREHEAVAQAALARLGQIDDPAAAERLGAAAGHHEARVRAAALRSLAWSGDRSDVPRAIAALESEHDALRSAAVATLAELGTAAAAAALARRLATATTEAQEAIVSALAWLRDDRALPLARALAPAALKTSSNDRRHAAWALVRLGSRDDRHALRRSLLQLRTQPSNLYQAYGRLVGALAAEHPDELDDLRDWAERQGVVQGRPVPRGLPVMERQPLGARDVPRLELAELLPAPSRGGDGRAKFGGQPDWIAEPMWPHTRDGRPLIFYGQLPLLDDTGRLAYIFIGTENSWQPLGEGNAVIVQPGPPAAHIECRPTPTGPQLYEDAPQPRRFRGVPRKHRPYERFARLVAGADPERWEWPTPPNDALLRDAHGDWNKIGGTGLWLQGEPILPGDGWRFTFQFTAGWAGCELGDGAECYGFVREDGIAALAWDSH